MRQRTVQVVRGGRPGPTTPRAAGRRALAEELAGFREFGTPTEVASIHMPFGGRTVTVPVYVNEFWTSRQRQAHSLHEVSYRACFKPQLPRFFIERLTKPGDVVYDPYSGRGTTALEAALLGRIPWACDVNPLSAMLSLPRLSPPTPEQVHERLGSIDLESKAELPEELLTFYHRDTLRALVNLRDYFLRREKAGTLDGVDAWIRMVAINRLTGHSSGFFSVYTLPPNQAVSVESQRKINRKRKQRPPFRDVRAIIQKKTRTLLADLQASDLETLAKARASASLVTGDCREVPALASSQVQLVVTSPPFLDIVDYKTDNWLRCWFAGIDPAKVAIQQYRRLDDWAADMTLGFHEHARLLRPGGHLAFEVGELRGGNVQLEKRVLQCGLEAGLEPELILINDQEFTKTSNCWGVDNLDKGTNTNRIVLFRKGETWMPQTKPQAEPEDDLKEAIRRMLTRRRGVPFGLVIHALSGKQVLPLRPESPEGEALVRTLRKVAQATAKAVNAKGIARSRPNEVGNDIEAFVKRALEEAGHPAASPRTTRGRMKAAGYPDIQFKDKAGRTVYVECKTYNGGTVGSTQRSFYLSPSEEFKVTQDGVHVGLAFEVHPDGRSGDATVYKVKGWKLVDLERLDVDVKYEFNSDNRRLYSAGNVLAQESLEG